MIVDVDGLGYLHAQLRRNNPLNAGDMHALLDGVTGQGHYVGTYLAWGVNAPGWWGEGELKFYLDGDQDYPTICGTGTEDYFGGAWNFDVPGRGYTEYTTPYLGMPQVIRPDGLYQSQQRFGMYRWHVPDPIHFAATCAPRSRRSAGSSAADTARCTTTSPRPRRSTSIGLAPSGPAFPWLMHSAQTPDVTPIPLGTPVAPAVIFRHD